MYGERPNIYIDTKCGFDMAFPDLRTKVLPNDLLPQCTPPRHLHADNITHLGLSDFLPMISECESPLSWDSYLYNIILFNISTYEPIVTLHIYYDIIINTLTSEPLNSSIILVYRS